MDHCNWSMRADKYVTLEMLAAVGWGKESERSEFNHIFLSADMKILLVHSIVTFPIDVCAIVALGAGIGSGNLPPSREHLDAFSF